MANARTQTRSAHGDERGSARADSPGDQAHTMQCMEVWGGNEAIDSAVRMPGLDGWVYARPYRGEHSGGDVHYVSSCATGRITRLMLADVAGHGGQVAELAVKLRNLMRRHVNYLDQTRFVGLLNREFAGVSEGGRFATAIVATYWAPTDFLVASNAGHPRPLLYRAGERAWSILSDRARPGDGGPANLPLGIDEVSSYDQFAVNLRPGDIVLMYTDSLIEAQDGAGRMLGEPGLLRMLEGVDTARPRDLIRSLVDRVVGFAGGTMPADDLTVLALAASGVKPPPTLFARISAASSFIRTLAGSWRPGAAPVPWPELSFVNIAGAVFRSVNRRWGGPDRT